MNQEAIDQTKQALRLVAAFKEKHDDCFRRHGRERGNHRLDVATL